MNSHLTAFFITAPLAIIPMLDRNARMDMIDLFDADLPACVENRYGGTSKMTELKDSVLIVELTTVSTLKLILQPDSTFCLEHAVHTSDSTTYRTDRTFTEKFQELKN